MCVCSIVCFPCLFHFDQNDFLSDNEYSATTEDVFFYLKS